MRFAVALLFALGCAACITTPTSTTTVTPTPTARRQPTQVQGVEPTPTPMPTSPLVLTPAPIPKPRPVACGDVITTSLVLENDLDCGGDALIVGASDVTIDLAGHRLSGPGPGTPTWPRPNLSSSGVKIGNHARVVVRNGVISRFASAVYLDGAHDSRVESVDARGNYYGIYVRGGEANVIASSTFMSNIYGITLYSTHRNRIVGNDSSQQTHFSPGGYGIYMYASRDNVISGNTFRDNENWGIWLSDSRNNTFFHNNVIRNRPQVSDDTGGNAWHDRQSREGNYWADWEGHEIAGTGIGTHPYLIHGPGGATDPYPFVREGGWTIQPRNRAPQSTATPEPTPSAGGGGLLVTLTDTNQVASVDVHSWTSTVLTTLAQLASNLALAADGRTAMIVDRDQLARIDVESGLILGRFPVGTSGRVHVAADRDGAHVHVLDGVRVLTYRLSDGTLTQTVPYTAEPAGVFASWKHHLLLVADGLGRGVDVVWVGGGKVSYRIPLPGRPVALAANRAGTRLFAAVPGSAHVSIVETEQYAVIDRIGDGLGGQRDVAISHDGGRLYVLLDGDTLTAFDLLGRGPLYTTPLPHGSTRLVALAQQVVVGGASANGGGWLVILDGRTGQLLTRLDLSSAPRDIVVRA